MVVGVLIDNEGLLDIRRRILDVEHTRFEQFDRAGHLLFAASLCFNGAVNVDVTVLQLRANYLSREGSHLVLTSPCSSLLP